MSTTVHKDSSKSSRIPYDLFKEKGFDGLVEWYEILGIENKEGFLDPTSVHTNEKTFGKIHEVMLQHYAKKHNKTTEDGDMRVAIGMEMVNHGPSGGYSEVPDDEYRVVYF